MTMLPIDGRSAPYKHKYLTEETIVLNRWFIWGTHEDGTVAIHDGQDEIMEFIPRDKAERLVAARNAFCQVVEDELGL